MPKVLFTKEISSSVIEDVFQGKIEYDSVAFLRFNVYSKENIASQIDFEVKNYLISSQNSVKAIKEIDLDGNFYVVGKKTASFLQQQNRKISVAKNYASELSEFILSNLPPSSWNFFCGKQRRDELIDKLGKKGHSIREIICYESVPQEISLSEKYDAIAFFSPLSVKTYLKNNIINKNTVIFTVGKTTSNEVSQHCDNKIITSQDPSVEDVINNIKNYFNAKE